MNVVANSVFAGEALHCTFTTSSKTSSISPPDISVEKGNMDFILSHIKKDGTAKLSGNTDSVDVTYIKGLETHNFLEVTPIGNTNLTTIFVKQVQAGGKIPAVVSRHTTSGGKPRVSQYFGCCEPIQLPD